MAVKIRLMRMGKKKQPTYRVVVADARSPRDGRIIESIGRYDPRQEPSVVEVDNERALHWLGVGAQPTERAQKLLEISGAWARFKISRGEIYTVPDRSAAPADKVAEEAPAEEAPAEEPPAEEPPAESSADGPAEEPSEDPSEDTATEASGAADGDTADGTADEAVAAATGEEE